MTESNESFLICYKNRNDLGLNKSETSIRQQNNLIVIFFPHLRNLDYSFNFVFIFFSKLKVI